MTFRKMDDSVFLKISLSWLKFGVHQLNYNLQLGIIFPGHGTYLHEKVNDPHIVQKMSQE